MGGGRKFSSVLIILVLLTTASPQAVHAEGDVDDYYKITLTSTTVDGILSLSVSVETEMGWYQASAEGKAQGIGSSSGATGKYVTSGDDNKQYAGSWKWTDDGYGPFNSFYAAFDPDNSNVMIAHLDPDDLTKTTAGESIEGAGYNIMWVIPTVYWYTDNDSLVLTNDPDAGGFAYAHTFDFTVNDNKPVQGSGTTYEYIAIGVYEAYNSRAGGADQNDYALSSVSGKAPSQLRADNAMKQAQNNTVKANGYSEGIASIWTFYQYELYKYCALAVMGGWDSQSIAGNGKTLTVNSKYAINTGLLDKSGPYAGTIGKVEGRDYNDPVKLFIENAWGSRSEFVSNSRNSNNNKDGIFHVYSDSNPTVDTGAKTVTYSSDSLHTSTSAKNSDYWGGNISTDGFVWGLPKTAEATTTEAGGVHDMFYIRTGSGYDYIVVGGNGNDMTSMNITSTWSNSTANAEINIVSDMKLPGTRTVKSGSTLCIKNDCTLTIDSSRTLTINNGAKLIIEEGAAIKVVKGNLKINGELANSGTISGNYTCTGGTYSSKLQEMGISYLASSGAGGSSGDGTRLAFAFNGVMPCTVTFDPDNGDASTAVYVEPGSTVAPIASPVRDGYRFIGWSADASSIFDFDTAITSNMTLKAMWQREFTVTFNPANGSASWQETVAEGDAVAEPSQPAYEGHRFRGWYADGSDTAYIFLSSVVSDLNLTAWWDDIYVVTLEAGKGGSLSTYSVNAVAGTAISADGVEISIGNVVVTATADSGYRFKGWSTTDGTVASDLTISAMFSAIPVDDDDDEPVGTESSDDLLIVAFAAAAVAVLSSTVMFWWQEIRRK